MAKKWGKLKGYQVAQKPKLKIPVYKHSLPDPPSLAISGPLISCEWSIPPLLADRLLLSGRHVPQPASGQLVIDTGASRTCITAPVAQELGLTPLRIQTTYGAGGRHELPVYRVRLTLKLYGAKAAQIFYDTEATGVEDLHEGITALNLMHYGQPVRLVGLLGRDLLRHATLTYRGTEGRFDLAFSPESLNQPPSTAPPSPTTHTPLPGQP